MVIRRAPPYTRGFEAVIGDKGNCFGADCEVNELQWTLVFLEERAGCLWQVSRLVAPGFRRAIQRYGCDVKGMKEGLSVGNFYFDVFKE